MRSTRDYTDLVRYWLTSAFDLRQPIPDQQPISQKFLRTIFIRKYKKFPKLNFTKDRKYRDTIKIVRNFATDSGLSQVVKNY